MTGPRPPVVLLHGCGGDARATFEATGLADAFRKAGRTVLAPGLPGHGRGERSRDPAAYADLAGSILAGLPEQRFDAVGYSLGGKLLLEIAIRAPERIGRMVLGGVGDNVFAPEAVAEAAAAALEHGPQPDTPPPVLAFLRTWDPEANDALAIAAVLRRPPNPVFDELRLAGVTSPVLLVNGEEDPAAGQSSRLRGWLPDARLVSLPGVDHFGLPSQPAFAEAAVRFIDQAA